MTLNRQLRHESKVIDFEEQMTFKIKSSNRSKIKRIINNNQDLYSSESHFVRAAVNRFLRDFDDKGKRF